MAALEEMAAEHRERTAEAEKSLASVRNLLVRDPLGGLDPSEKVALRLLLSTHLPEEFDGVALWLARRRERWIQTSTSL